MSRVVPCPRVCHFGRTVSCKLACVDHVVLFTWFYERGFVEESGPPEMQQVAWLAWREQVYVASPGCESTDRSVVRPVSGVGAEGCGVRVREAVTNRSVYLGYSRG